MVGDPTAGAGCVVLGGVWGRAWLLWSQWPLALGSSTGHLSQGFPSFCSFCPEHWQKPSPCVQRGSNGRPWFLALDGCVPTAAGSCSCWRDLVLSLNCARWPAPLQVHTLTRNHSNCNHSS